MGNENNNPYCNNQRHGQCQVKSSSPRPSIFAEVERVKEQVEFDCLGQWIKRGDGWATDRAGNRIIDTDPLYGELCLIIAEVNLLNPDAAIKVAGAEMPAYIVQEVYTRLAAEHLRGVVQNFQKVSWTINHKKTYLRTALYNSVFESESTVTNQIARDMPWIFGGGAEGGA